MGREIGGIAGRGGKGDDPNLGVHPLEEHGFDEGEGAVLLVGRGGAGAEEQPGHAKDPGDGEDLEDQLERRDGEKERADSERREGRRDADPRGDAQDVGNGGAEAEAGTRGGQQDDVRAGREEAGEDEKVERVDHALAAAIRAGLAT